jgi:cell division protein FtsZ
MTAPETFTALQRRAHRAAEAAIANPLFDDASLNGARGVLISITGGKDLTLYEVDEAASRIRQEVDEEANIIVGAIIDPALEQGMRVSVVATGIDQSAICRISRSVVRRAGSPPKRCAGFAGPDRGSARQHRRVASTNRRGHRVRDSASSSARHPISRVDGPASDSGRGDALRSASNSTAARQIRRRSVGKASGSKSIGLN